MNSPRVNRDEGLDALRGLAILAMVASHLAREVLSEPYPFALQVIASLAAPLFVTLVGVLTAKTSDGQRHPISHYLKRGGEILLLAALIDAFLWGLYPFTSFDVLYLIGVAVPLAALFHRLRIGWQIAAMICVLAASEVLRRLGGYSENVFAVAANESPRLLVEHAGTIAWQGLISGWFPIFPWLAFAFLGVWISAWQQHDRRQTIDGSIRIAWWMIPGVAMLGVACLIRRLFAELRFNRGGYPELFYPPDLGFVAGAAGVVLVLFAAAKWTGIRKNRLLIELGQSPLTIYVAHLVLLRCVVRPLFNTVEFAAYFALYGALILGLHGLARVVAILRQSNGRVPTSLHGRNPPRSSSGWQLPQRSIGSGNSNAKPGEALTATHVRPSDSPPSHRRGACQ